MMKSRKRQHGRLMRLHDIYKGKVIPVGDQKVYIFNDDGVPRVRVYGVILQRYDSPTNSENKFSYLTIDDGSDTIRLKLWSRPINQDNGQIYDRYSILEGIKQGDIVDVLGRVREYEGELFIVPESISKKTINWEINRRAKLLKQDIENKGMGEVRNPFNDLEENEEEDYKSDILNAMEENAENNTIDTISDRTNLSKEIVEENIKSLQYEGVIISPKPGIFEKLDDI